jgi:hypothetical protein
MLSMCDYSLQHVASRPASVGEKLVSTTFANSFTRGFAVAEAPAVAVCLLPGTEVAFEHDVHYDPEFHLFFSSRRMNVRVARFRQINTDQPHAHHDALEFPNGQIVLLTRLIPGQKAVVLQLPATATARSERLASVEP